MPTDRPWEEIEAWRERERLYEDLRRRGRWAEAGDLKADNWGRDGAAAYEDWCNRG